MLSPFFTQNYMTNALICFPYSSSANQRSVTHRTVDRTARRVIGANGRITKLAVERG